MAKILSLYLSHDGCMTYVENNKIIFHTQIDRYSRLKHYSFISHNIINIIKKIDFDYLLISCAKDNSLLLWHDILTDNNHLAFKKYHLISYGIEHHHLFHAYCALTWNKNYENILFTENAGRSGKQVTAGFSGRSADKGIRTTKIVKSVGCSILKLLVEQNQFLVNDFHTINELSTFSKKGNSYEAESGKHDDLVMCLVLFAWLSEQQYFKDYTNINTLMSLREKTEEDMESDLSPFGFIFDGRETFIDEEFERIVPESWMWNAEKDF